MQWYYLLIMLLCFFVSGYSLRLASIIVYKINMRFPSYDHSYKYYDIKNRLISNLIIILLIIVPMFIFLVSFIFYIYVFIIGVELFLVDFTINIIYILKLTLALILYVILTLKYKSFLKFINKIFKIKSIYDTKKYIKNNLSIYTEKIKKEEKFVNFFIMIIFVCLLFPTFIVTFLNLI